MVNPDTQKTAAAIMSIGAQVLRLRCTWIRGLKHRAMIPSGIMKIILFGCEKTVTPQTATAQITHLNKV
jgi:hypothetical protein